MATARQWREELTIPWTSTTGGPLPAIRYTTWWPWRSISHASNPSRSVTRRSCGMGATLPCPYAGSRERRLPPPPHRRGDPVLQRRPHAAGGDRLRAGARAGGARRRRRLVLEPGNARPARARGGRRRAGDPPDAQRRLRGRAHHLGGGGERAVRL